MPNLRPRTIPSPCTEAECSQDAFTDLAGDVGDTFEEFGGSLEWHHVVRDTTTGETAPGGSDINSDFGFVENDDTAPTGQRPDVPATTVVVLPYMHSWFVPGSQKKALLPVAGDEFTSDYDQVVVVPAQAVRAAGFDPSHMDRDGTFFRFEDGTEARLEACLPTPKQNPVTVRILCSNRKPEYS